MARRPLALPSGTMIMALADRAGRIAVRVTPGAGEDCVKLPSEGGKKVLVVRTTCRPEQGEANEAVVSLVAKAIGRPRSAVTILKGQTSRDKVICVS